MKNVFVILGLLVTAVACKKYKDPNPINTTLLTNKYCNDPSAVNFNWNFPGMPDNTVCVYPAQVFKGLYFYRDSIILSTGEKIVSDSFPITISQLDTVKLTITGFCTPTPLTATANKFFKFVIDSTVKWGQIMCNTSDTISGNGFKQYMTDSTIKFNYTVYTDTGKVIHTGLAIKP